MMTKSSSDTLPPKHQLFADAILAGKNKTNAAIAAGYSVKTAATVGCRMFKYAQIVKYLNTHKAAAAQTAELSHEYVLKRLMQIQAGKDSSVAVRALELLGKHLGMFPERSVVPDPAGRATDDLATRREQVRKKLGYGP